MNKAFLPDDCPIATSVVLALLKYYFNQYVCKRRMASYIMFMLYTTDCYIYHRLYNVIRYDVAEKTVYMNYATLVAGRRIGEHASRKERRPREMWSSV